MENYDDLLQINDSGLSVFDKIDKLSRCLAETSMHIFGKTLQT